MSTSRSRWANSTASRAHPIERAASAASPSNRWWSAASALACSASGGRRPLADDHVADVERVGLERCGEGLGGPVTAQVAVDLLRQLDERRGVDPAAGQDEPCGDPLDGGRAEHSAQLRDRGPQTAAGTRSRRRRATARRRAPRRAPGRRPAARATGAGRRSCRCASRGPGRGPRRPAAPAAARAGGPRSSPSGRPARRLGRPASSTERPLCTRLAVQVEDGAEARMARHGSPQQSLLHELVQPGATRPSHRVLRRPRTATIRQSWDRHRPCCTTGRFEPVRTGVLGPGPTARHRPSGPAGSATAGPSRVSRSTARTPPLHPRTSS